MYAIRNTQTQLWYDESATKWWVKTPTRDSLFYTKKGARLAMRDSVVRGTPCEIVPMQIVPKETKP